MRRRGPRHRPGEPALLELEELVRQIAATNVGETHEDYLAYIKLDQRFHQSLIDCVDNAKLSEIYAGLRSHTLVTLALYAAPDQRASDTLSEHERILIALRQGDAEAAKAAVRAHLRNAREEILLKVPEPQNHRLI